MKASILLVEDEPQICRVVKAYLEQADYTVTTANNGKDALRLATGESFDLIILDLMLPGISGEEICQRVRHQSDVPIIMLTAKSGEEQRIVGLELGADDYIVKPFSPRELVARVKALLRRTSGNTTGVMAEILRFDQGRLEIHLGAKEVRVDGEVVKLTPTEFKLLEVMARQPGHTFSRSQLVDLALGYDFSGYDDTIYAHIKNLRRKIEPDPSNPKYIETVYGLGYRVTTT